MDASSGLQQRGRILVVDDERDVRTSMEAVLDDEFDVMSVASVREGLAMLSTGLSLVRAHPVTGIGPGQVKRVYPQYAAPEVVNKTRGHLHDTPIQILVERVSRRSSAPTEPA